MISPKETKEGVVFTVKIKNFQGDLSEQDYDVLLSPKEAYNLITRIIHALFGWHQITGKTIDRDEKEGIG